MSRQHKISLKKILYNNSVERLRDDIETKMGEIDANLENARISLLTSLIQAGNPLTAVTPINLHENIRNNREILSKTNYHFPDVLSLGELVSDIEVNSAILKKKNFITKTDLMIPIRDSGVCVLINHKYKDRIQAIMETVGMKLIGSLPDGLAKVTIIDKSGSGQNFPNLSRLHEKFIEGKILSDDNQIEAELEEIRHSMSAISQSISANGFDSVEDYNKRTDEVPQRYNFIFVNGFPDGFNKKATDSLVSLIESGYKSGIYVIMSISYDPAFGLNQTFNGKSLQQIIKHMTTFEFSDRPHMLISKGLLRENVELLKIPLKDEEKMRSFFNSKYKMNLLPVEDQNELQGIIRTLNKGIENLDLRPVIDIEKAYVDEENFWKKDASGGVCIPFGKKGIENVYLTLGVNQYNEDVSAHHAVIGGTTGSGKTVLLNDIILLGSMLYSPEDLQFFLLDYKEGTEFAIYKNFPHVQILAMKSEIEFGHEVLDKVLGIIVERGELFKSVGAANLKDYNSKVPKEKKLPMIITIIDEFQVLFPKDQRTTSKSNEKINDILRRGRSFGLRLMLATQTLKGVDIDPQIMSNIPIKIALRMEQQDAAKILSEDNSAAKFLSSAHPGEGVYNSSFGVQRANVYFQAFKAIGPSIQNTIDIINKKVEKTYSQDSPLFKNRFVYNGELGGNFENLKKRRDGIVYIGEPAGLNVEHVGLKFNNEFGENMLVVGSNMDMASSMFYYIAKQTAEAGHLNYIFNFSMKHKKFFNDLGEINSNIDIVDNRESEDSLKEVYRLYEERVETKDSDVGDRKKIFLTFFYIESAKIYADVSYKNKNADMISDMLKNGPDVGIHILMYTSDYQNLSEVDLTRELAKFKKRVAIKGGSSIKVMGLDTSVNFSSSDNVAIASAPQLGNEPIKFKPYILENKND